MDLGLEGARVLITGSTAGIGFAAAVAFAREGAQVTLNGRSDARVREAVEKVRAAHAGADVRGVAADVGTAAGCDALIAAAPDVDVLVNNAGIFEPQPFEEISDASWFRFYEVNVMSGVRLARHHLPRMLARNSGRILFISSESAVQIPVEMIHYGMTKTAQLAIARGLAERCAGTAVTVNSVLPGPTRTEGVETFMGQIAAQQGVTVTELEKDFISGARPSSLIQRLATPDEVASMIVYAASARASATNGAALRVDGGVVRSIV